MFFANMLFHVLREYVVSRIHCITLVILLPGQRTIKLLGLGAVAQPSFFISSRLIVKDCDLLKSRMKITAYNQHDVGSFSESLGFFRSYHRTLRDRANVVMQSSAARNLVLLTLPGTTDSSLRSNDK